MIKTVVSQQSIVSIEKVLIHPHRYAARKVVKFMAIYVPVLLSGVHLQSQLGRILDTLQKKTYL